MVLLLSSTAVNVSANSVSFDSGAYAPDSNGQISINVLYDFTSYAMFGGGVSLLYDASALEFVSFTQDDFGGSNAQPAFSPNGALIEPGFYQGFGIGAGKSFLGITDAGSMGVFVFIVTGSGDGSFNGCLNGAALCLTPNLPIDPMVSVAGQNVTDAIFANEEGLNASVVVPLPASVWFLLSGLLALLRFERKV
ncbi:MAG: hypothetical protein AB8G18_02610 [Gammaproteobacteria bacterium]